MQAERLRAEVVAANMANAETTRTESGGPYKRQHVVFAANQADEEFSNSLRRASQSALLPTNDADPPGGVHVAEVFEDTGPPLKRYDPGHPDAGADGYVAYPDIPMRGDVKRKSLPCSPVRGSCSACIQPNLGVAEIVG